MSATITIQGNVTREPEIRITGSGAPSCSLSVAVNRKVPSKNGAGFVESVSYFTVVAYQALATNACETLRKGLRVVVTGRFDQRVFETATGEKRTVYELVADDIGASLRWATGEMKRSSGAVAMPVIFAPPLPVVGALVSSPAVS